MNRPQFVDSWKNKWYNSFVKIKTSFREYDGHYIRAIWDKKKNIWWYSVIDILEILANPSDPRKYWNTLKARHKELSSYCDQVLMHAKDKKKRNVEVISSFGINELIFIIPSKNRENLKKWLKGSTGPIDEQSREKAYSLWNSTFLQDIEVGTTRGLQQIHEYIFGGLYEFAGQIRKGNISKNGFHFALCQTFKDTLPNIDRMPQKTLEQIIEKYISMNYAHPFREGNGRSMRIWLDLILKKELGKCVDWAKIPKEKYFGAMIVSLDDSRPLFKLIDFALTSKINDREVFMKGIETSYYYEEE